ncbi:band 3 anion transport protein isoform X2 [Cylas formicarius]|uniref:band 3 anion transport protein isoform X2 n=1 Tax=Cylas formicarius TaxID=197179 RepID=UPI0029585831|nr:band 3 anion transport protein isoform X2 [Cylas formicarius]XP_060535033.1 band 3 anion transport protein isoform X2 [Cylas formicarius]
MNRAQKNNLKKLSFLGFAQKKDGGATKDEVQLDDECAKVFAMDNDNNAVYDFHDDDVHIQPKFNEKDYEQHRHKGYPHIHVPLKKVPKSMRRRNVSQESTPANTPPVDTPTATASPTAEQAPTISPLSSIRSKLEDTETGPLNSPVFQEESDVARDSSESECVLSDPCNYHLGDDDFSPDKKVSFLAAENGDTFDLDGLKKKKKKHHYDQHRKYSLPVESMAKKRHHHYPNRDGADNGAGHQRTRRVSTQPEDEELRGADKDQLDSHRSDDPRGFRRHKTSRPSQASLMHIGKGVELHPYFKKLYDHSPHAIFVELSELITTEIQNEREWKETARWIKYEEDVEEGVDRWGKPHVASLSFHSLLNLRKCLENGVVILDLEEKDLPAIAYRVSEDLFKEDLVREEDKARIMRILLVRHRHVNEHHERGFRFPKKHSYTSLQSMWLEHNMGYDAAMMARCSVCSAQGRLCLPHAVKEGRSFSVIGFPNSLSDTEKRKVSYPDANLKNGDAEHKLLAAHENHTVVDIKDDAYSASTEDVRRARNDAILKRIPAEAQGASVLVGEMESLEQPAIAFVRLAEAVIIPSLIEVYIPVRFIFILLGPKKAAIDYHEIGRSISTLMANQQFHNIAYKAESRKDLLSAINEFLDDSIVLPPGDWERQALLPIEEIKAKSDAIKRRKENALKKEQEAQGITKPLLAGADGDGDGGGKKPPHNPLVRTKRPWGGLINDLKNRYPYYRSDFTDAFNAQCLAASIFMYFAAVSGGIAFGGLSGLKTDNQIGISENLLFTSIAGIIFALLGGQPLIIIGTTAPLLLFDESLLQFCQGQGIEFLPTRIYIGLWLAVIGIVVSAFEGSVLVKLFTRFTEDIFSALIVLLYIIESIQKIYAVYEKHPILPTYCDYEVTTYRNATDNDTVPTELGTNLPVGLVPLTTVVKIPTQDADGNIINQPNTALFCTILTLFTFAIAYYLKIFRNSHFLGRSARRALGDFGVPIAIICNVFLDFMVPEIYTEKLSVPEGLSPSKPEMRGWLIPPFGMEQPLQVWVMFAAIVPAMLVYILLFMETHICELILNKKERKLKKGGGFHLDIVIICITNILAGFFGFTWMCAATVRSIAHASALTVMSRTHAPGEKPHLVEIKEQRLSSLLVSILVGLSVFMSPLLRMMPMAVLFGIFLYMGVASTDGIQLFDRMWMCLMPVKHHPQVSYVRKVRTAKMHLFTCIQVACLVVLWIVKSTKASLAFPFFLILMIPVRDQMKRLFTQRELRLLDGDQVDVDDDEPDFYAEAPLPG